MSLRIARELLQIVLWEIIHFFTYGLGDANEGSISIVIQFMRNICIILVNG